MIERALKWLLMAVVSTLLVACGSTPKKPTPSVASPTPGTARPGAYYLDDGPGTNVPDNLDSIADAVPRAEKFHSGANKPYTVFGRSYAPTLNNDPFRQTGIASWYGRKFHGNMTSIGEIYNMYAMTAAHPTLPLPSYVRVTNPANAKSVVVRLNDRGPFHSGRVIDLSYAAAHRLDIARRGSGQVIVERVFAGSRPSDGPQPIVTAPTRVTTPTPSIINTPPPPVVTTSPIAVEGSQLFLQLGAFGSQDNANIFRDRMVRELDWNREPLLVVFKDGLWRVRLGPYTSRVEADAIQARVKQSHDFSPVISKP